MLKPSVGRVVHYRSYGTPGGEFEPECRAAVVTEVDPDDPRRVGLVALNPTGVFFHPLAFVQLRRGERVEMEALATEDLSHLPREAVEASVRYLAGRLASGGGCVQDEDGNAGGTWHWPERVDLATEADLRS